jgi:thioredoxin reductase (NADPH)
MAKMIGDHMGMLGTKFINGATPSSLARPDPAGRIQVTYSAEGKEVVEEYDTVFFAIGRYALTSALNLDKCGVTTESNGKIRCVNEQTNIANIYAIGDVL